MDNKLGRGWERADFNVRLSKRRREKLLALAKQLPDGATPNDAVDRGLELALASPPAMDDRFDDLEMIIESKSLERRAQVDKLSKELRELRASFDELRELLARLAAEDG